MEMILDPTILFFCLGVLAIIFRSNIEIPPQTTKFLAYYLLMSLGFKGGIALNKAQFDTQIMMTMLIGIIISILIPICVFYALKRKIPTADAAAAAACYGSASAVTFLTAISWLENNNLGYGGHMVALMVLVESPAIIVGMILARMKSEKSNLKFNLKHVLHEAFFNGSVFILIGSMIIGYLMNPSKAADYQVFVYDIFKGFLCFFLLDLGMSAAKQIKELKGNVFFLTTMSFVIPLVNAIIGLFAAQFLKLAPPDGFLLMVILGSASYIAVPAALKTNLPEARTSIYLSMSLGLTFPFNILIGIPTYWWLAEKFLG